MQIRDSANPLDVEGSTQTPTRHVAKQENTAWARVIGRATAVTTQDCPADWPRKDPNTNLAILGHPAGIRLLANDLLRCGIFNARNRNQPRRLFHRERFVISSRSALLYSGAELRQSEASLALQLIELAINQKSEIVYFSGYELLNALHRDLGQDSYQLLRDELTRLRTATIAIEDHGQTKGLTFGFITHFAWSDGKTFPSKWMVRIDPVLISLFGNQRFTYIDWEQRLSLPVGLAMWLHSYFSSHRDPFPILISNLATAAGINPSSRSKLFATFRRALDDLVDVAFLERYDLQRDGLLTVRKRPRK